MKIRVGAKGDAPSIAQVNVDTWRTAFRGIVPAPYLAGLSYKEKEKIFAEQLADPEQQTMAFVAEDEGGRIIGFVSGGRERSGHPEYPGEIYAIYVQEQHQGKGVGKALFEAARLELQSRGFFGLLLWTPVASPYRCFYERLGGKVVGEQVWEPDDFRVDLIGYGWGLAGKVSI